jgi:hypothetical protein
MAGASADGCETSASLSWTQHAVTDGNYSIEAEAADEGMARKRLRRRTAAKRAKINGFWRFLAVFGRF